MLIIPHVKRLGGRSRGFGVRNVDWMPASKAGFIAASGIKDHTGLFCRSHERVCMKATDTRSARNQLEQVTGCRASYSMSCPDVEESSFSRK